MSNLCTMLGHCTDLHTQALVPVDLSAGIIVLNALAIGVGADYSARRWRTSRSEFVCPQKPVLAVSKWGSRFEWPKGLGGLGWGWGVGGLLGGWGVGGGEDISNFRFTGRMAVSFLMYRSQLTFCRAVPEGPRSGWKRQKGAGRQI